MTALGIDLSLVSTGMASLSWTRTVRPKKLTGYPRLRYIRSTIMDVVLEQAPHLVVVEGPSYGSVGQGQHERGGLWWMVTEAIDNAGIPLAIVPPACLKKYATGTGGGPNAGKDAVLLAASRRFEWFAGGNDEADALWLAAMGFAWLGQPLVTMPEVNLKGLDGCKWPQLAVPVSV